MLDLDIDQQFAIHATAIAIKELMEIHKFKKKPRFINYKKFYDLKIPETAEKLKYPFTQIYLQKNFLSKEECKEAIEYMDTELHT